MQQQLPLLALTALALVLLLLPSHCNSQRYVPSRSFLGAGNLGFNSPQSVAVDWFSGSIFVADTGNDRVVSLWPNGTTRAIFNLGFVRPTSLAFDTQGNLLVTDSGHNRIVALSPITDASLSINLATGFLTPSYDSGLISSAGQPDGNWWVAAFGSSQAAPAQSLTPAGADWGTGAWVPNGPLSDWIGIDAFNVTAGEGSFEYVRTFTVPTWVAPGSLSMSGLWTCDNECTLFLNDRQLTPMQADVFTGLLAWIATPSDIRIGMNQLIIRNTNTGGPGGVRLEGWLYGTRPSSAPVTLSSSSAVSSSAVSSSAVSSSAVSSSAVSSSARSSSAKSSSAVSSSKAVSSSPAVRCRSWARGTLEPDCRCPARGTYPTRCLCTDVDGYYPNCEPDDPVIDSTGSSSSSSSSGSGLGGGAIAGIVIITLVGVLVIAWVYWYFFSASGELSRLQRRVPIPGLLSAPAGFGASTENDNAYHQQGL